MPTDSPLGSQKIVAFAATAHPVKAKAFYRDTLGLKLVHEDGFALAFDVQGVMLRVTTVKTVSVAPYTVLGWLVDDIAATAQALRQAGVEFRRYPGITQDELGIWQAPSGAQVAWFHDPDGNILSITQF
jgi:catechol 2,3-dioxygenase-like lactoylglutathione lyase family enzyme